MGTLKAVQVGGAAGRGGELEGRSVTAGTMVPGPGLLLRGCVVT